MKLGFIGTGNMAGAIMGGIIKKGIIPAEEIIGSDIMETGRNHVKELYGIQVTADNKEVAEKADILVLSVKPQFYAETIQEIRESVREDQMVITIAPGKTLAWLVWQTGQDRAYHAEYSGVGRRGDDGSLPKSVCDREGQSICT